jgi:cytochrome b6-f complex iron-sulfur subunit
MPLSPNTSLSPAAQADAVQADDVRTDPDSCASCRQLSRRTVIRGAGAVTLGAAATLLAACSPTAGSSPSGGGVGGGGAAPTGGSGAQLAKVADVPVGGALAVPGPDGKPLILSQPVAGTIVGMSAICTHAGCTVMVAGSQLVCPCHGSVYKAADGSNVSGPAPSPLPRVAVHVQDGVIIEG